MYLTVSLHTITYSSKFIWVRMSTWPVISPRHDSSTPGREVTTYKRGTPQSAQARLQPCGSLTAVPHPPPAQCDGGGYCRYTQKHTHFLAVMLAKCENNWSSSNSPYINLPQWDTRRLWLTLPQTRGSASHPAWCGVSPREPSGAKLEISVRLAG